MGLDLEQVEHRARTEGHADGPAAYADNVLPRLGANLSNGRFGTGAKPASEWVVDCKAATVKPGKAAKADVTLTLSDADFVAMAAGKLNGMQAFMSGKMKIKGNMALAQKFGALVDQKKSKL